MASSRFPRRAALALAWALGALALATSLAAAQDFGLHLKPGEGYATGWMDVPAGQQVDWETVNGTGFVKWRVESQPHGELAGGEGKVERGCAVATEAMQVRVVLENNVLYNVQDATFVVRVTVGEPSGQCSTAAQLAEERRALGPGFDGRDLLVVASAVGSGVVAMLYLSVLFRRRKQAREKKANAGPPEGRETLADAIRRNP